MTLSQSVTSPLALGDGVVKPAAEQVDVGLVAVQSATRAAIGVRLTLTEAALSSPSRALAPKPRPRTESRPQARRYAERRLAIGDGVGRDWGRRLARLRRGASG